MKKELRQVAAVRADAVGEIRGREDAAISEAKATAAAELRRVEDDHEKKRRSIVASYEAKASSRRVERELAAA